MHIFVSIGSVYKLHSIEHLLSTLGSSYALFPIERTIALYYSLLSIYFLLLSIVCPLLIIDSFSSSPLIVAIISTIDMTFAIFNLYYSSAYAIHEVSIMGYEHNCTWIRD